MDFKHLFAILQFLDDYSDEEKFDMQIWQISEITFSVNYKTLQKSAPCNRKTLEPSNGYRFAAFSSELEDVC